jgi:hypothetical protein
VLTLEGAWRKGKAGSERVGRTAVHHLGGQINQQKNREMGRPLALDGRRLMGGHNNQPKVFLDGGGGIRKETQPGQNVWGTLSHCLGRQMEQQKREMGGALAIDGRQSNILHTRTNQKQAAATEGSMEGKCNKWEVGGSTIPLCQGGVRVDRGNKLK